MVEKEEGWQGGECEGVEQVEVLLCNGWEDGGGKGTEKGAEYGSGRQRHTTEDNMSQDLKGEYYCDRAGWGSETQMFLWW